MFESLHVCFVGTVCLIHASYTEILAVVESMSSSIQHRVQAGALSGVYVCVSCVVVPSTLDASLHPPSYVGASAEAT